MSSDNEDANRLIIESIPLAGMAKPLIDQHQATKIRAKIALALGMEDEELALRLAYFQRNGCPTFEAFHGLPGLTIPRTGGEVK